MYIYHLISIDLESSCSLNSPKLHCYITTFGILTIEEATFISVELANKAYTHLLMALELTIESTTEPYTETNLFAYNTATTIAL